MVEKKVNYCQLVLDLIFFIDRHSIFLPQFIHYQFCRFCFPFFNFLHSLIKIRIYPVNFLLMMVRFCSKERKLIEKL